MATKMETKRIILGISGATGVIYGIRMLEVLKAMPGIETHVVISPAGYQTIAEETDITASKVAALADVLYDYQDIGARIASGSYQRYAMIVAPCSIKTMSSLATCLTDNLLTRAGDVTLKEGRPLVLVVRETPLHIGHLRLMLQLAEMGGIIMPPMPAFYHRPQTIAEMVDFTVGRVLDRAGLREHGLGKEWRGSRGAVSSDLPEDRTME